MSGSELPRTAMVSTNGHGPAPAGGGSAADDGSATPHDEIADYMMAGLRRSMVLNLAVRGGLGIIGLSAAVSALTYTWAHAAELVAPLAGRDYSGAEGVAVAKPVRLVVFVGVFGPVG